MTIYVYPSTLPGEPLEAHDAHDLTLEDWLRQNVEGYEHRDPAPISATVNGVVVEPIEWADVYLARDTVVEIRPQPKEAATLIAAVIAAVASFAAAYLMKPSLPGQQGSSQSGSELLEASGSGNKIKLGDVIPEIAGRRRRYPDYLTAPRRYFAEPKKQSLDLLLCLGVGDYSFQTDDIKIGETPITALGNSINVSVFGPGEDVTGHQAHQNWYNAPEVGPSTGGSGLSLNGLSGGDRVHDGGVGISGDTLTFGIPDGWSTGLELSRCDLYQTIAVTDDAPNADILSGQFQHLSAGMSVTISGDAALDGNYVVASHTDTDITLETDSGTPVTGLPPGNYSVSIDLSGARYLITERVDVPDDGIVCERLLPDGNADATWSQFPALGSADAFLRADPDTSEGFWAGPFAACPEAEVTSRLEFDIFAPEGLGWIENDGDIVEMEEGHDVELQYREIGTSTWTSVIHQPTGKTRDQLGFTYVVDLPSAIRPEVRVRRTSAEDTRTQARDTLEWYGLRARLPHASSYPDVTVIALTITGSDAIASRTEDQISVIPTRVLPVRDSGAWTTPQATRDIAPWFAYVAKSVGYTDAEIDMMELDRLDGIWSSRNDYFDYVEAEDSTVKEALNRALRVGMAELTVDAGKLRPVRDEPRTQIEHVYSPQNVLEAMTRSVQALRPDDADGVDVEYVDGESWSKEVVPCRLPGDAGVRPEKVRVDGVTDRTKAWRIGMRRRREIKHRRWSYSFDTWLDALNSRYFSYDALVDDVPGYGQSSLLEDVEDQGGDSYRLVVSEPLEWKTGESHVVAWRRPDGTLAGPFTASQGDDAYEVVAGGVGSEPVPVISLTYEPPHVLFGTNQRWSYPVLITDVSPNGFESVSVEAVGYDERVYTDDDNAPA